MKLFPILFAFLILCLAPQARAQFSEPPIPTVFTPAAIQAASGRFARWRDEAEARWVAENPPQARPQALTGYFAVLAGPFPGVARFNYTFRSLDRGEWLNPPTLCERTHTQTHWPNVAELVYLGPEMRPEFAQLDLALGGPVSERRLGRMLSAQEAATQLEPADTRSLMRHYPPRAADREQEGSALLECHIREGGRVSCFVAEETPPGWGFGYAAWRISGSFRAMPLRSNGESATGYCASRLMVFRLQR